MKITQGPVLVVTCLALAMTGAAQDVPSRPSSPPPTQTAAPSAESSPSSALVVSIDDSRLKLLVTDVLERNPKLAILTTEAHAAAEKAPQVRALPDPVAGVTAFLMSPQTRVGPQQAALSLSQHLPWFGKLRLREQTAIAEAAAAEARVEAERLRLVTEARREYYELAFLHAYEQVVTSDRATLGHYEELARARYASGVGHEEGVVKIQAEITRDDTRLLDIRARRATLTASLNALRDQPASTALQVTGIPDLPELQLALASLSPIAVARRPEVAAADAAIQAAQDRIDLAGKAYDPDVTVGLNYALVGTRSDAAGRANPPEDNGQDILGLSAGINLPVHRRKLAAGVEEATAKRLAASETRRQVVADIEQTLGDLTTRIPLIWQRLHLFTAVLTVQARQSLASAEAGYEAGTLNALDLLDAERVLLEVRTATERARTDYAVAVTQLEGAVGAPVRPAGEN